MEFGGWQRCSLIDFPGKVSAVLFTKGCSFRRPFCHNPGLVLPNQPQEPPLSEEAVLEFLHARKGKLDGVVVSGGEPTIHKALPAFLRCVKDLGFEVKLDTNGDNPYVVEQLIEEKTVDYFAMDIKASAARYSVVSGVAIDPEQIWKSVSLIMNSSCSYEFRTTVVKELHEPEEIPRIAQHIQGASKFFLQQFRPLVTLDPALQSATPYSADEMEALCESARPYVQHCAWR